MQLVDGSTLFRKMRKGRGSKRNELGPDDIQTIVRLYGNFVATDESKILDTTNFLYRTITVERPLKLNFATTDDRIEGALAAKSFGKLTADTLAGPRTALDTMAAGMQWWNREDVTTARKKHLKTTDAELRAPQFKVLLAGLPEHDDAADARNGSKGTIEAEAELHDTENTPGTKMSMPTSTAT